MDDGERGQAFAERLMGELDIDRAFAKMDEDMKKSIPTDILKDVGAKIDNMPQLNEAIRRRQRDWGIIANQVVGAEPR